MRVVFEPSHVGKTAIEIVFLQMAESEMVLALRVAVVQEPVEMLLEAFAWADTFVAGFVAKNVYPL